MGFKITITIKIVVIFNRFGMDSPTSTVNHCAPWSSGPGQPLDPLDTELVELLGLGKSLNGHRNEAEEMACCAQHCYRILVKYGEIK